MAKTFRYQHLRSSNSGVKPSSSVIREGELAVNFATGNEKIFLKNANNEVIDFITESQIDAKISAQSGASEAKIEEISGAVDTLDAKVDTELAKKVDSSAYTSYTAATETALNNKADTATTYTKVQVDEKVANDIKDFFDGAVYDSNNKRINFKHGDVIKTYIDATDFIKDGMVDNVKIDTVSGVTCLVITFNSDSGKEEIDIPLYEIFNPNNYYTKTEIDAALSGKVDNSTYNTYTAATDAAIALKANTADVNNAIEAATSGKVNTSDYDVFTANTNTAIGNKADSSALTNVNDVLTAHTADTTVHITAAERTTWNGKQDALVSGTNIKTVVSKDLLGNGNVEIGIADLSVSGTSEFATDGDIVILDAGTF